jgi:hypothetical protein
MHRLSPRRAQPAFTSTETRRLPAIVAAAATTTAATTTATTTAAAAATATAATAAVATAAAAATTTAAAAEATAAATTTTTATTALPLLRFVDAQGTAVEQRAVHFGDCLLRLGIRAHRDERKAARFTSLAVGRDVDVAHLSERSESGADRVRRRVKRQITYVETITHFSLDSIAARRDKKPIVRSAVRIGEGQAGSSALTCRSLIASYAISGIEKVPSIVRGQRVVR